MAINPNDRFSDVLSRCVEECLAVPESDRGQVFEKWRPILEEWGPLVKRQLEMADFFNRLVNRQGTTVPDFAALYERKADLDHKLTERS
ncbi:MAG TPA: hypothetical protein VGY66_36115 [Gemmataceae bacterium]|nr:hypothetical protein [Gemmataceae bacterium]